MGSDQREVALRLGERRYYDPLVQLPDLSNIFDPGQAWRSVVVVLSLGYSF